MHIIITDKRGKTLKEYSQFKKTSKIGLILAQASKDFHTSIHRIRFTYYKPNTDHKKKENKIALTDDQKTFKQYKVGKERLILVYKDLGPQISWKAVFLIEYFGPILLHAIPYFFAKQIYFNHARIPAKHHQIQDIALGLIFFHYLKREFETLFVHRFSNATMPFFNVFKNSFHYWVLGGISISYFLYHPLYTPPAYVVNNPALMYGLIGGMVFCELMNFDAHLRLKNLRRPGTKERGIPKGQLFSFVSCANYFWEISAWTIFAVFTNCLTSYFFAVIGAAQMMQWGLKKHSNYKKEFGKKYPRRKAIFPFIL